MATSTTNSRCTSASDGASRRSTGPSDSDTSPSGSPHTKRKRIKCRERTQRVATSGSRTSGRAGTPRSRATKPRPHAPLQAKNGRGCFLAVFSFSTSREFYFSPGSRPGDSLPRTRVVQPATTVWICKQGVTSLTSIGT